MTARLSVIPPRRPRAPSPESVARDASVRAAWESGASLKATARAAGVATTTARDILARLGIRPSVRGKRNGIAGGKDRAAKRAGEDGVAPHVRRRLPLAQGYMVPTAGAKLDCQKYTTCLSSHVAAYPTADASCPRGCPWFVPVGRLAGEYTYATEGGSLARMTG